MTFNGGVYGDGNIFSINTNGSGYSNLHNFNDTNGELPFGSLISNANSLFGITSVGGGTNGGCIFTMDTNGSGYSNLHNFTDANNGANPYGSLLHSGSFLFGMTNNGGVNNEGSIFRTDTNGNNYKDLLDFSHFINGARPTGSLIISGSTLYGMVTGGLSCIFSIDTNGTGFKDILNFNGTNGRSPDGSLTISQSILYGMTSLGGANDDGLIFSIDTNGTQFNDLLDFNGTNGSEPMGDLTLSGNKLYGMTFAGGMYDSGTIFSIDTNGNGYRDLLDFIGTKGVYPRGSLSLSGGVLYGVTTGNFARNYGNIFSIDTNGNRFKDMLNFNDTDGAFPYFTELTVARNILYGMTWQGGGSDYRGTIYAIDTNGNGFTDLYDFGNINPINGDLPLGSLTLIGGKLYGMTSSGGINGDGVIFRIDTNIATSINEISNSARSLINVYPNPSTGIFTISLSGTGNLVSGKIEVYNVLGENVLTETPVRSGTGGLRYTQDDNLINLMGQPSGVYFYRVLNEDGSLAGEGKVVIEK
jgi:uncharacterized repeat protein (TIGR03803 family)